MSEKKINLVAADMGYGHQRAAYPLRDLSNGEVITINNYEGIPSWERSYWIKGLRSYERISRLKKIPFIGEWIFSIMDFFQKIPARYPSRDLSQPIFQQKYFYRSIKKGMGRHLIEKLSPTGLPFVTTFFVAAYIAEHYNYPGDIYCIICDTDASRSWAPINPAASRTKFLVPSGKVKDRFMMYGVKKENIIVTGFPLPKENIGFNKETLQSDLARRVVELDPKGKYREHYQSLLDGEVKKPPVNAVSPLVITFAVGGAGAQKEIGAKLITKLSKEIADKNMRVNLVAGNRLEIKEYFLDVVSKAGLKIGEGVDIVYDPDKTAYFKKFNDCLHDTDILWTKPSELSFYCALGLPIIMSAPVGSQEDFNRDWLLEMGAGIDSLPLEYVTEWLPDMLYSGRLARAAMNGFLNAEQMGAYNIEKLINDKK